MAGVHVRREGVGLDGVGLVGTLGDGAWRRRSLQLSLCKVGYSELEQLEDFRDGQPAFGESFVLSARFGVVEVSYGRSAFLGFAEVG